MLNLNFKTLFILILLVLGTFTQNLRTNDQNIIINWNFQLPTLKGTTMELPEAFGWFDRLQDKINFGKGNLLNSLWPVGSQVLVLKKHSRVYQSMTLPIHDYQLQLQYSISVDSIFVGYNFTTDFRIYWNGIEIFHINPTSSVVQTLKTRIKSVSGSNTLELVGNGQQDCDDIQILIGNVKLFQIIQKTQKQRQVYALLSRTGFWTSTQVFSDKNNGQLHNIPYLDYVRQGQAGIWIPITFTVSGSWIQIFRLEKSMFVGFQTQGRQGGFVKSYKVQYSNDGITWKYVQNGRMFPGNVEGSPTTRVRVDFASPIQAKSLRFYPIQFFGYIALHIDAIYLS